MPATAVSLDLPLCLPEGDEAVLDALTTRRGERGQGMVEYAFILVLVAMVVLVSVVVLGKQTSNLYSNISSGLGA
jgi:pilus assembly protein Flp/PilA